MERAELKDLRLGYVTDFPSFFGVNWLKIKRLQKQRGIKPELYLKLFGNPHSLIKQWNVFDEQPFIGFRQSLILLSPNCI